MIRDFLSWEALPSQKGGTGVNVAGNLAPRAFRRRRDFSKFLSTASQVATGGATSSSHELRSDCVQPLIQLASGTGAAGAPMSTSMCRSSFLFRGVANTRARPTSLESDVDVGMMAHHGSGFILPGIIVAAISGTAACAYIVTQQTQNAAVDVREDTRNTGAAQGAAQSVSAEAAGPSNETAADVREGGAAASVGAEGADNFKERADERRSLKQRRSVLQAQLDLANHELRQQKVELGEAQPEAADDAAKAVAAQVVLDATVAHAGAQATAAEAAAALAAARESGDDAVAAEAAARQAQALENARIAETRQAEALAAAEIARARRVDAMKTQGQDGLSLVINKITSAVTPDDVKAIITKRVETLREKVPEAIKEELHGSVADLKSVMEGELPAVDVQNMENLPQLSLIIAGLCAPFQLKMLHGDNLARLAINGTLCVVDLLALLHSANAPCITEGFWWFGNVDVMHGWLAVDAGMLSFTTLVSINAFFVCSSAIAEIDSNREENVPVLPTDAEAAFRVHVESNLLNGARAMVAYDAVAMSSPFKALPYISMFDFVWQVGGWFILFDTPKARCKDSLFLLYWTRGRGMVFLVGFVIAVVGLALTALKAVVQNPAVARAVLKAASAVDESFFPDGPPIGTLLVRSFLVRDSTDLHQLELQIKRADALKAGKDRDEMQTEHSKLEGELAGLEAEVEAATAKVNAQLRLVQQDARDREFLMQYSQAVTVVLDSVEIASTMGQAVTSGGAVGAFEAAAAYSNLGLETPGGDATGGTGESGGVEGIAGGAASFPEDDGDEFV